MEPARPDLIQAVHAFQALQYFGRVLRLPDAPRQRVSHQVSRIDEFWSHSWHGSILSAFDGKASGFLVSGSRPWSIQACSAVPEMKASGAKS